MSWWALTAGIYILVGIGITEAADVGSRQMDKTPLTRLEYILGVFFYPFILFMTWRVK